ncbi:V-type ATP synthase subunit D [bacterium]|nr:V-type ATP synthase subunit D [bacterium]
MAKIKFSKNELKKQRDALNQFKRYLPILQLKKQQLQMEMRHHLDKLKEQVHQEEILRKSIENWAGLLGEKGVAVHQWLVPERVVLSSRNVAGVNIFVFKQLEFAIPEYDLFLMSLWIDRAIEFLRELVTIRQEIETIKKNMELLKRELRITTQRVNLFEKIKIPEAEEAIRVIKVYLGDQMANAVGRSKIAKRKIESSSAANFGVS